MLAQLDFGRVLRSHLQLVPLTIREAEISEPDSTPSGGARSVNRHSQYLVSHDLQLIEAGSPSQPDIDSRQQVTH